MDNFVVCRIKKMHSFGEIGAASNHNYRTGTGSFAHINPNPKYQNVSFLGSNNILNDVKKRLNDAEKCANGEFRKNAVFAVEMILSASHAYFTDKESIDIWAEKNVAWLKKEYSKSCVNIVLHLDEQTPHIQAFFVPIDDKNKLNCRALFGGKIKMKELQDNSFLAVKDLGILRGIPKEITNAEHQTIATWRKEQQENDLEKTSLSNAINNLPCITSNITNLVYADNADIYYKKQAIKAIVKTYVPKLTRNIKINIKLQKENKELKKLNEKLELENKSTRKRNFDLQQSQNIQDKLIKNAYEEGFRNAKIKVKIKFNKFLILSKEIIYKILPSQKKFKI